MAKHSEIFANCTIEIEEDDSLRIAGKEINYDYDPVAGQWSASYLPYTRYDSLLELARAIAGDTVEFVDSLVTSEQGADEPGADEQPSDLQD